MKDDLTFFGGRADTPMHEAILKRSVQDVPDLLAVLLVTKAGIWTGGRDQEHQWLDGLAQLIRHSSGLTNALASAVKRCPTIAQKLHLLAVALNPNQLDEMLGAVIESIKEHTQ